MKLSSIFTVLFTIVFLFISGNFALERYREYWIQPEDIITSSVQVPDYQVGGNPLVIYDRDIKIDFVGNYRVEVKDVSTGSTVCSGKGDGIAYESTDALDASKTTLDWYIGTSCAELLRTGQYVLKTTYTIRPPNIPTKYLTTTSNIFEVK